MALSPRITRSFQRQSNTIPRKTPSLIPSTVKLEEESLPHYRAKQFYPVRIGQTFMGRYEVVGKLGYGGYSTVWLAKDIKQWRWQSNRYVALKILTNDYTNNITASHEINVSRRVATSDPSHKGAQHIRLLLNSGEIDGPNGKHSCLVQELLREPLWLLQKRFPNKDLTSDGVKAMTKFILLGIDFLHTKCHVIHTDLKSNNIMVGLENETVISDYVKAEAEEPSAEKLDGDRTVYLSRNNFGHPKSAPGPPKIADFGLAVFGDTSESFHHPIQPDCFRAPEVTLDCGWTYSADIWNLGVFIWELLQKKMLFCAGDKEYDVQNHVAEIIALLGPPPKVLLERGSKTSQFFNEDGQFQRPNLIPTNFNFESLESSLKDEDKTLFIEFMKKLLRWLPEERASAWELYNDPWLHTRTTS